MLLIPLDVIQRDAVEVALPGEHTGQQRAVIVGVGFVAKNGDVENLPALEKFFQRRPRRTSRCPRTLDAHTGVRSCLVIGKQSLISIFTARMGVKKKFSMTRI